MVLLIQMVSTHYWELSTQDLANGKVGGGQTLTVIAAKSAELSAEIAIKQLFY